MSEAGQGGSSLAKILPGPPRSSRKTSTMPAEIKVPSLGESVLEATIGRWLKKEGEPVAVGDPLVELETDKVNQELESTDAGVLERILRQEGETVKVGEALAVIGSAEGAQKAEGRAPSGSRKAEGSGPG